VGVKMVDRFLGVDHLATGFIKFVFKENFTKLEEILCYFCYEALNLGTYHGKYKFLRTGGLIFFCVTDCTALSDLTSFDRN
jgi:hypothetical protein